MLVLKKMADFYGFLSPLGRLWRVFVGGTGWCLAFCGAVRCSVCANGKFSGFC